MSNENENKDEVQIANLGPDIEDEQLSLLHPGLARRRPEDYERETTLAQLGDGANQLAPRVSEVAVSGGQFGRASFDTNSYNLTRREDRISGNLQRSNFGEQTVQYIQNQYVITKTGSSESSGASSSEGSSSRKTSTSDEDYIRLSDKLNLFKKKSLCKRAHVFEGEETSEITGPRRVAIKFLVPYDEKDIKEARILLTLAHHPNIVSIIHSDKYNEGLFPFPTMYIAMELCHTKTLAVYIVEQSNSGLEIDVTQRKDMIKQIATGLDFIHGHNIVHRDLKPDNILFSLDGKSLKISDFGLGKELKNGRSVTEQSMTRAGTDGYRAPETYNKGIISQQADIFSFGLLIHYVLTNGNHPYGKDPDIWNYNIKHNISCNIQPQLRERSPQCIDLIECCLKFEPRQRPSTKEVLRHPFFEPNENARFADGCTPRNGQAYATIFVVDRNSNSLFAYTPNDKEWTQLHNLHDDMAHETMVLLIENNFIYAFLGNRSVYRIDYPDDESTWSKMADMGENHGWYPPVVVVHGHFYAIGNGYSPDELALSSAVESYNPVDNNQWTPMATMGAKRQRHYITSSGEFIYCCGVSRNENARLERYSVITDIWENISSIAVRSDIVPVGIEALKDIIYVIGGMGIYVYDTRNDVWVLRQPSETLQSGQGSVVKILAVDNAIYGIGKMMGKTAVHQLQLDSMDWKTVDSIDDKDIMPDESTAILLPREKMQFFRVRRRFAESQLINHSQAGDSEGDNSIFIFNRTVAALEAFKPSTSFKWTFMHKIPKEIIDRNFTVVSLDDYIYVLMDNKTLYRLNYVDFEPKWQRRAETIENHGWLPPVAAMDGFLYVIGRGYTPYPYCSRRVSERYNPNTDEWTRIKNMNGLREFHYVAPMDGYIYCFGGHNDKSEVNQAVERYHAATDDWDDVSPIPVALGFPPLRGVALGGLLYVIDAKSVQTYDPATEAWTILTPGRPSPFDMGAAYSLFIVDGEITAVGQVKGTNEIRQLDRRQITWEKIPGMETIQSMDVIPRESVGVNLKIHPSIGLRHETTYSARRMVDSRSQETTAYYTE